MNIDEMEAGPELDALMAEVMGWEKLNVEYFGTQECSERQIELRDWMNRVGLASVGTYFISVQYNFWIEAQKWNPSTRVANAFELLEHIKTMYRIIGDYTSVVVSLTVRNGKHIYDVFGYGNGFGELPLAICRAAYKAAIL